MFQVIINFLGGTCLLIFGVNMMSKNLENISGRLIKDALSTLTNNLYMSFLFGTIITALLQSSTAVMLITVSLVNARLMSLIQAAGIIYGANIGTTITAQLMSANITDLALLIFSIGFIFSIILKKPASKTISKSIMGLGIMFLGIKSLQAGIPLIQSNHEILSIFQTFGSNPLLGIIIGAITTMMIQSSSATIGLTIVLFSENLISFSSAISLTLGDNIGTCATAQIASQTSNINARRTAWAHTFYNIIGVVMVVLFFLPFRSLIEYVTFKILRQDSSSLIANTHTILNILSAVVFLPITKHYIKFIEWIIPEKKPLFYHK